MFCNCQKVIVAGNKTFIGGMTPDAFTRVSEIMVRLPKIYRVLSWFSELSATLGLLVAVLIGTS